MFAPWRLPVLASRPWRLCPELDDFPDDECEVFAAAVAGARAGALVLAFVIAIVVGMAGVFALFTFERWVGPHSPLTDMETVAGRAVQIATGVVVITTALTLAFWPYVVLVRLALLRHIERVVCPHCRYSLLGLPVAGDTVQCPECGRPLVLADLGLRPEDIMSGARERAAAVHRPAKPLLAVLGLSLLAGAAALYIVTGWGASAAPGAIGMWLFVYSGILSEAGARRRAFGHAPLDT